MILEQELGNFGGTADALRTAEIAERTQRMGTSANLPS
jgi:hypothetical protein